MLYIGENAPFADLLSDDESLESWKARGAPLQPTSWYIWTIYRDAGPMFGPFKSHQEARDFATSRGYSTSDVLNRYPCSCHGDASNV